MEDNKNENIAVNIVCSCKKKINHDFLIVLLLPCNHFIHEMCINKCLLNVEPFTKLVHQGMILGRCELY